MRPLRALAALGLMIGCVSSAHANSYDNRPKILLHVKPVTTKNACTWGELSSCTAATTSGGVDVYSYIYLIVARGSYASLDGVHVGVTYEHGAAEGAWDHVGLDMWGWYSCVSSNLPGSGWPNPGTGALLNFSPGPCATGDANVLGYFYVAAYAADTLRVVARPGDVHAVVANCALSQTDLTPSDLGYAVFSAGGSVPGCNPCLVSCQATTGVPTDLPNRVPVTWSGVKARLH